MNREQKSFRVQLNRGYFKELLKMSDTERICRYLSVFIMLVGAILIELLVFNYKHWTSIFNKPVSMKPSGIYGMLEESGGTYLTVEGDKAFEFAHLNRKIKNARVEIVTVEELESDNGSIMRVDFDGTDESHKQYYSMSTRMVLSNEPRSQYITFHFYGDASSLFMGIYPGNDKHVLANVTFNVVVPIFFHIERVVLIFLFFLLVYFMKPGSVLHRIQYASLKISAKYTLIVAVLVINAVILLWINGLNPFYQSESGINTMQYQELAEAFSAGQLSVLDEPCDALKNMENPYDMGARGQVMEFGEWYFDHAYFNGKYYVYFGVVPAVLIYWPYYVLTGEHIHNHTVCYIGIVLILLGIMLLYDEVIRRFARKCSVAMWYLTVHLTIIGSYLVYISKRPDLYSVPIVYAVAFSILGMWGFFKAMPYSSKKPDSKLNKGYLILGSVLTALVAGCRPQIFLVVLLGVIILRQYCFDLKYLRSKDGILSVLSVFVPMAIIGGLLMAYNALRFDSPFDFGAFYNLTFNDMRNRGWVWDRIPLGFSIYLFHPVNFISEYPYFGNVWMDAKYMGETIEETTYGGIFMSSPFSLLAFISFFYASKLKKRTTMWLLSVSAVLIAVVIMVVDTVNSGLLARYFFDFSFLWMIAAGLAVLNIVSIKKIKKTGVYNALVWTLIVMVIFEVIYQCLVFMLDSGDYLMGNRQDLFYHLYYLFGFAI